MSSTGNSDIQRILADVMANRPYSHRQNVDPTVVAVVTVEEDMRFLPDTMGALLRQTVLPGVIVIADCAGGTGQLRSAAQDRHGRAGRRQGRPFVLSRRCQGAA